MIEDTRRTTTVHDRYHITDECCGIVETAMTFKDALEIAQSHARRHARETDNSIQNVKVYDSMARKTAANEWTVPIPATNPPASAESQQDGAPPKEGGNR
jgi:hypothetical protein